MNYPTVRMYLKFSIAHSLTYRDRGLRDNNGAIT